MAVTFRNITYAGEGQDFFRQLVAEIVRLERLVVKQQTEIDYLKRRVD